MSFSIRAVARTFVPKICTLAVLMMSFAPSAFAQSVTPPLVIEPELQSNGFSTNTFIPDFLGPGFVNVGSGSSFDFNFEVPAGEEGLYQIQVRHANNKSLSILIDGNAIAPDMDLSTRTLGFWFDNEAYVTLAAGPHSISFVGPVFLDTFRISRTPPDADRFLTYPTSVNETFFAGNEDNSIAYYNTIDPNGERATLAGFRELNQFSSSGVDLYNESDPAAVAVQEAIQGTDFSHAVYQNIADLDLGRNMYVLKFPNGDVASYVQNFATPDNALDRRNLLATVAMEYRADERLTTFYAYDSRGNRVTKVDLDGRGQKYVPTLCAACHGGKPKDDIDGVYQNGGNIGSKWIAWDLENFEFSSRLSIDDQLDEFRSMNQAVLCTTPSASNAELIRGWYGADTSANCSVELPANAFNGEFVPEGWNNSAEHRELYLEVVRPTCRSCHAQRGTYSDNQLLERKRELEFSTFEHFELYKDRIEEHVFEQGTMPSALVTYEAFWRSRGSDIDQPEILDRVLFGGTAHVNPPVSLYSDDAKSIYGARRTPGVPVAEAAVTEIVTNGVEGRLTALPSKFAHSLNWSVSGGDPLPELPSNETTLTVTPTTDHEVTLSVSNFAGTYTDTATVDIITDEDQRPSSVFFEPDIRILLQSNAAGLSCTSCHQSGGRANTVYHFSEPADFIGNLTPEQFAYSQALTRVDCRDPESSLLLRRAADSNHFGGAVLTEGDRNWTLLRRWIAEGAPFDAERSFIEPGSDCGVVITDPDPKPFEGSVNTGIRAEYPRVITINGNPSDQNDTATRWVQFANNTIQVINRTCRLDLVNNHDMDERVVTPAEFGLLRSASGSLSCDAIGELPRQDINSVPAPVQAGLNLEIREFAVLPDNTSFGNLRVKPGMLAMAETGGRLFVTEQHEGKIWEVTDGGNITEPWLNMHQEFITHTGVGISGENLFHGGLRGLAFHPEFATNGKFYTSQMRTRPDVRDGINYLSDTAAINVFTDSTLSEWTMNSFGNVTEHRELFRIGYPAEDHLMKQISFNPYATPGSSDYGLLYIGHGDGTLGDFFGNGQNDDALGKILRIDPLANGDEPYTVPTSNPFSNDDTWETDEVYAMGLRNPHHIAFAKDGTTMVVDIGRANIEEVNLISAGSNHGWPDREGTFVHQKETGGGFLTGIQPLPSNDADFGFTYPAAQYGHIGSYGTPFTGHSIAGGYVVENGSAWDGQYLYGDFVNFGDVYHTTLNDLKNAVTTGSPDSLTQGTTSRAQVHFDHDNDPSTDAQIYDTMLGVINDSPRYFSHSGSRRADIRFGQGPGGEIYVMNKRNNTIYLVTNSVGEDSNVGTGVVAGGGGTPGTDIAPTTISNLRHSVYSSKSAELFWDPSTDDGFVRGYEIVRNGENLGVFDSLSLFQPDLDPTVIYTYVFTAVDFDNNRSTSATLKLNTGGLDVNAEPDNGNTDTPSSSSGPTTPGSLRHDVYSLKSAELFWDASTDEGFVQGYEIIRNGESLGVRDALSLFQSDLDATVIYTYEVTAVDTDGNRSETATVTFSTDPNNTSTTPDNVEPTTPDTNGPTTPGNLRNDVYSKTSAELFWDRSTDDGFVQGYEIVRNGESLGVRDATSLFQSGLDPAVTYTFELTAIDTDGNRSPTTSITFSTDPNAGTGTVTTPDNTQPSTPDANSPTTPGNFRRDVYSKTSAELFWDRSTDNGFIQGYEIVRNGESLGVRDATSLFQSGLNPAVVYTYQITAIDTDGNRSAPANITFSTDPNATVTTPDNSEPSTPDANSPTTPGNLRRDVYSKTSAELFWDRSTDNGLIQGYEIVRNGESLGVRDATSLFQTGLDPAQTYTYTLTAIDTDGNRSASATLSFTTGSQEQASNNEQDNSTSNLASPTGLRSDVYSSTSAELTWDRPAMLGLFYEVRRNGDVVNQTDGVSFFDNELSATTTYQYQIVAVDIVGNRSQPVSVSLTTR